MEIRQKKSVDILKKVCYNKADKAYIFFCKKGGLLGRFAMSKTERMEKMNRPLKKSDWIVCSLRIVLNNAFRTGVCGRSF